MEKAELSDDVDGEPTVRDQLESLLPWLELGAGFAPLLSVLYILGSATNPGSGAISFGGYVSNPTYNQTGGSGGGSASNASIDCEPNKVNIAPLPPPNTTTIAGIFFIPYEYVSLQDQTPDPLVGTIDLGTVQADVNGQISLPNYKPTVSGNHTIIAVDLTQGFRVTAPLYVYEVVGP